MTWRQRFFGFKSISRHEVTGRGTILTVDAPIEEFRGQKTVKIDGIWWVICGIECGMGMGRQVGPLGVIVRPL